MTTPPPESVEQLAERMASVHGGYFTDYYHKIACFLRSHGIDPATMQVVEKEHSVGETIIERLRQANIDEPPVLVAPPPEPVVTERDRELAKELLGPCDYHPMYNRDQCEATYDSAVSKYATIIARHNAAEREELASLKNAIDVRRADLSRKVDALEQQLAESQKLLTKWSDAYQELHTLIESASWQGITTIGTLPRQPHPATQPSHEGRDGT